MAKAIHKSEILPERQWAWDVKEEDFQVEFQRKYPRCDAIPTRTKYLLYKQPPDRSIAGFNEEQLIPEDQLPKPEKNWDCPGCGKEFTGNHIGRKNHVKACKATIKVRG